MVARWIWNRPAAHPAAWAAGAAAGALGGLMMAGPAALAQGLPAGVQGGAAAQGGGSYAVVQPLPVAADPGHALDAALSRLARNPLDPGALVAAGDAALAMGDSDAAIGFYTRAERVAPGNAHARAGLAGARLRAGEPLEAVDLFDRAARDGALSGDQIADRGLAYDMLGDNGSAQRFYREALANGAGDEAVRRLALSQAMAGDARAVEITLAPLLQRQDRAAWRTKAFAFAILGREEEAVAVARSTMPTQLAEAIAPYLRFMRRLTPAQQAAAANLGRFPRASDIGQDDPKIAAWAAAHGVKRLALAEASPAAGPPRPEAPAPDKARKPRRPRPATLPEDADSAPGEPTPSREEPALPPAGAAAAATPAPQPAYPPAPAFSLAPAAPRAPAQPTVALPPPAAPAPAQPAAAGARQATAFPIVQRRPQAAPASAPVSAPAPAVAPVPVAAPQPRPEPAPAAPPAPSVAPPVAPVAAAPVARPVAPRPQPRPVAPPRPTSFADAFGAWAGAPNVERVSGAVDIRKITPARPAPKAPPPPAHPSRIWVQVGVGRDTDRIAFDWHRMVRDEPELLHGRKPSVTEWGRTNRLLLGPFDTEAAAHAFNDKLRKAGHDDAFVWISPAGQAVDALDQR